MSCTRLPASDKIPTFTDGSFRKVIPSVNEMSPDENWERF